MSKLENTTKDTSKLASSVLERIEKEQLHPESRLKVKVFEYGVWVLWALTVTFGAISVAVMFFVGDHARFALYEATHDTPFSFAIEVLPQLWILIFALMSFFAYVNFRHTKRGYRYPVVHVLLSSLIFSVAGGVFLHLFGVGEAIDAQLGQRVAQYVSMEKMEQKLWQEPAAGRLLGTFNGMDETDTLYMFTDSDQTQWRIETMELRMRDKELLSSGHVVRVLGTSTDERDFYACGVFPWMFGEGAERVDMRGDREDFIERMYEHMETRDRLRSLEEETYGEEVPMPFVKGKCGELAAMKRMRF